MLRYEQVKFPATLENHDRQTDRPTNKRTAWVIEKFHFQKKTLSMAPTRTDMIARAKVMLVGWSPV